LGLKGLVIVVVVCKGKRKKNKQTNIKGRNEIKTKTQKDEKSE
jgi:hypothetical protein